MCPRIRTQSITHHGPLSFVRGLGGGGGLTRSSVSLAGAVIPAFSLFTPLPCKGLFCHQKCFCHLQLLTGKSLDSGQHKSSCGFHCVGHAEAAPFRTTPLPLDCTWATFPWERQREGLAEIPGHHRAASWALERECLLITQPCRRFVHKLKTAVCGWNH